MQQSGTQLGYILNDIDCKNLSPADIKRIKFALFEHGMICFKKQFLEKDEQVKFTQLFGELIERPDYYAKLYREPGYPSIIRVGTIGHDGKPVPKAIDAESWHKDGTFEQHGQDFIISILNAKVITNVGGQTGFVDCEDTYNKLPEELKQELEGGFAICSSKTSSFFTNANEENQYPDAYHPIFEDHPISKRKIHFIGTTIHQLKLKNGDVVDASPYNDKFEKYYNIYCHQWEEGDLVVWDNYRTLHKGMGGFGDSQRLLLRTQCRVKVNNQL